MVDKAVCVIGLGEVGMQTFLEICKKRIDCYGVDIEPEKIEKLSQERYKVGKEIRKSDIYIIAVYTTQQVFDVLEKIDFSNNPLIVIESTIMPGTYKKIIEWKHKDNLRFDLILFPHRYNPNDPEHKVFNLMRVMGGDKESIDRAKEFYKEFMPLELIHPTTPEIAELSKPLENAYRFIEIAVAEELKMLCGGKGINFEELRKACNTKWNINIKETRDGINGKCLPKDTNLINEFFQSNKFIDTALSIDKDYRKFLKKKS